jgi:hypothetical protein
MMGECCDYECLEKGDDVCQLVLNPPPPPKAHSPTCEYACCVNVCKRCEKVKRLSKWSYLNGIDGFYKALVCDSCFEEVGEGSEFAKEVKSDVLTAEGLATALGAEIVQSPRDSWTCCGKPVVSAGLDVQCTVCGRLSR